MTYRAVGTPALSAANSVISLTPGKPPGTVANDVMILTLTMNNAQTTVTGPSGWTLVHSDVDNAQTNMYRWIKVAGSSEPSNYTVSWGASGGGVAVIESHYDIDTTTPIVTGEEGTSTITVTTSFNLATATITTAGVRNLSTAWCDSYGDLWTGPDTDTYSGQRASNAASLLVQHADGVAAGSISRTATKPQGTGIAVASIIALNPASAPDLAATASADVTSGTAPLDVTVTIAASGGTGDYTYDYDWGDSTSDTGQTSASKTHTYSSGGSYTIGWSVTDV